MKFQFVRMLTGMALAWGIATASMPAVGADADKEAKAPRKDLVLKGDAQCTRCHDGSDEPNLLTIGQTRHGVTGDQRTPTCTTCHGASEKHLQGGDGKSKGRPAPDVVFKKGAYSASEDHVRTDQCLTCHKGEQRTNWHGSQHQVSGVACNDCHKAHQPVDKVRNKLTQTEVCFTCHKEQRAETHKISAHPIAVGKVVCSDCHNPHGSTGPKSLAKNTINETCFVCHAEKRGPFLFEHRPAMESCTNCHTPHGSNISPLLISRPPFMCQQCHDGTHASTTAAGPNVAGRQNGLTAAAGPSRNLVGRACMNCHSQIHGSNSPAGGYLQR